MIKGCRRKMVIVSGLKDSSFETAYFVLKDSPEIDTALEEDILERANSIIENYSTDTVGFKKASFEPIYDKKIKKNKKRRKGNFLIPFFTGFISAGIIFSVIFFIFI